MSCKLILAVLFGLSVTVACQQSQPIVIVEESPTLFTDEDIDEAILQVSDEVEIIPVVVDGVISDGEVITTDSNGEEDSLNTLLNVNSLSGYVCNIINNTNGRNKWRIQSINAIDESVIGLVGIKQDGRAIQSIGCVAQGNKAAFSMKTSASADYEIFLIDFTGSTRQVFQLTNNNSNDIDVSISADGNTIVWQSWIGSDKVITVREYAGDGSFSDTVLDGVVPYVEPSVNSDGTYVAFIDIRSNQTNLLRYNINNGNTTVAYTVSGKRNLAHPSVSNNGERVAWMDGTDDENFKVKDLTTNTITEIVTNNPNLEHGFIADDGTSVVYSVNRDDKAFTKVKNVDDGTTANVGRVLQPPARYRGSMWVAYQAPPAPDLVWSSSQTMYTEGDGNQTLTLTRNGDVSSAVTVTLLSDDTSEVNVPSSVVIPQGSSQASVVVEVQDDLAVDGDQVANITAISQGYNSGVVVITVKDNDIPPSTETHLTFANGDFSFIDINGTSSERVKVSLQTSNGVDFIRIEDLNDNSMHVEGSDIISLNQSNGAFGGRVPLSLVNSVSIDTKDGSDSVTFELSVNVSGGLTILSKEISLSPQTGASKITVDTGDSRIRIEGTQDVRVSNVDLLTNSGNITLSGNTSIDGICGAEGGGDEGLLVSNSSMVHTLSGSINMLGCGGTSGSSNYGVRVTSASKVRTTSGSIDIKGTGGNSANGHSNYGVFVNESIIESLGMAEINIQGIAGSGTQNNFGFQMTGTDVLDESYITSVDGDINVSGYGGINTTDVSSVGFRMTRSAAIESTGAAKITVYGEGGTGNCTYDFSLSRVANLCNYYGVDILWDSVLSSSGTGEIHVVGRAGTARGRGHHGVHLAPGKAEENPGRIESESGDIYVTGYGGIDTSSNSSSCSIPEDDRTDSCFDGFAGIYLTNGGLIEAKNAANVYMTGHGGQGGTRTHGVFFEGSSDVVNTNGVSLISKVLAEHGNIVIVGNASQNTFGGKSNGLNVLHGVIKVSGTGNIDATATGGAGAQETNGIQVNTKDSKIQTNSGSIVLYGEAGVGTGNGHVGINLVNGGKIYSDSGNIDMTGKGGLAGTTANYGISTSTTGTSTNVSKIQTGGSGYIKIHGTGGGNGTGTVNVGVRLQSSGGIFSDAGLIDVTALNGKGTNDNNGLRLEVDAPMIQTSSGDITINADASASATNGIRNRGVFLRNDSSINTTTGDIVINATGAGGSSTNNGLTVIENATVISSSGTVTTNAQPF